MKKNEISWKEINTQYLYKPDVKNPGIWMEAIAVILFLSVFLVFGLSMAG